MRKFNLWKDTNLPDVLVKTFDARFGFSKESNRIAGFVDDCLCEVDIMDDTLKFNWYGEKTPAFSTIWNTLTEGGDETVVYDNNRVFVKFLRHNYQTELRYSSQDGYKWNKIIVKFKQLNDQKQ